MGRGGTDTGSVSRRQMLMTAEATRALVNVAPADP